jgi:hypothetical protein
MLETLEDFISDYNLFDTVDVNIYSESKRNKIKEEMNKLWEHFNLILKYNEPIKEQSQE